MASRIIGRTACPECTNPTAHVKQSEKCLYRYCPDCGAQYFAKTPRQVDDLKAKMRATPAPSAATESAGAKQAPAPAAASPVAVALPVAPAPPVGTPAASKRGLFGF